MKCGEDAFKNDVECLRTVLKGYLGCAVGCTAICMPALFIGPGYAACIVLCEKLCAEAGITVIAFCHAILLAEIVDCSINYYKCTKKCNS